METGCSDVVSARGWKIWDMRRVKFILKN